ncbi:hypothetical protein AM501_01575 [Aneurinibacillus migulanus]|uniref:hypothetical protein n=1 Tax=Aneurinibacillus migulanus TaxID=47500 RepID=UPI0006B5B251|nr:hypothetical protein [Aneurinibacillus migulanus]KPD09918.1 hypothetical protein AM501_01575 [Aneurinibacillus migulanus]
MATVGQKLIAPEPGWMRVDSTDTRIEIARPIRTERNSTHYAGSLYYGNITTRFKFKGTKLRLIGLV